MPPKDNNKKKEAGKTAKKGEDPVNKSRVKARKKWSKGKAPDKAAHDKLWKEVPSYKDLQDTSVAMALPGDRTPDATLPMDAVLECTQPLLVIPPVCTTPSPGSLSLLRGLSVPGHGAVGLGCRTTVLRNQPSSWQERQRRLMPLLWASQTPARVSGEDELEPFQDGAGCEVKDLDLLMRRQGLVTDAVSLHVLVEQHLPLEDRQLLIPCAFSGNTVFPGQ
ncbi:hypothetical protein QTO34_014800 [Cnephaeus nilssonii]|uniref:Centromere protein T n=1 Tax=Cnephaeus nilssonii TaxID=3371016 RepID=A0AA40LSM3_CNENI|nr:hypothetical protein QTO34_014800 [Eptesicus nilssonii]